MPVEPGMWQESLKMAFDAFAGLVYRMDETLGGSNFGGACTGNPVNV